MGDQLEESVMRTHLKEAAVAETAATDLSVRQTVESVIAEVRAGGDDAVRRFSQQFDRWAPSQLRMSAAQIQESINRVPQQTIDDIVTVQNNVRQFAELQKGSVQEFEAEVQPGVFLGQKNVPVSAVGAYIPGGRYPLLASAHMTIVTAKVAGVPRVVAATPAPDGVIPDASVAAIHLAGADEIYLLGGVQAVAAMAVGCLLYTSDAADE